MKRFFQDRRWVRLSFRYRLTLLFALVFGVGLVVFGISIYGFMNQVLQQEFDDALFNYGVDVLDSITLNRRGDLQLGEPEFDRAKIYPFPLGSAYIQIRHASGAILVRDGDPLGFDPPYKREFGRLTKGEDAVFRSVVQKIGETKGERQVLSPWSFLWDWVSANDKVRSFRILNVAIDDAPKTQLFLQIVVPRTRLDNQLRQRRQLFIIGIPIVLALLLWGSYFLSGQALDPIRSMIRTASEIDSGRLSDRVPVPLAKDELRSLAETLNQMLDRIERAFRSQEKFVADASHQLLSPITVMKGELQSYIRESNLDAKISQKLLVEVDQLSKIVKGMLLLSRVDAGVDALSFQKLALDELVIDSISRLEKLAHSKGTRLSFNIVGSTEAIHHVKGDYDLLLNLIMNLIENAIKFSPSHSHVQLQLEWGTERSTLSVQDEGPGVSESELNRIFARFSRSAGTSKVQGFGLGLAIAKKIADLHDARLWVQNGTPHGALFCFEIKNF